MKIKFLFQCQEAATLELYMQYLKKITSHTVYLIIVQQILLYFLPKCIYIVRKCKRYKNLNKLKTGQGTIIFIHKEVIRLEFHI